MTAKPKANRIASLKDYTHPEDQETTEVCIPSLHMLFQNIQRLRLIQHPHASHSSTVSKPKWAGKGKVLGTAEIEVDGDVNGMKGTSLT